MTTAVICPVSYSRGIELAGSGGLWRKKLLPAGSITYQGRKIDFTRDYLSQLAAAFRSRAYDQVPFQLAGDDNKHNNNVRNFGGEVTDLRAEADGLYALVRPTEDGAAVLRQNPRLGISARIVEDYQRADGQFFPAAIQHVLGTLDPRVPGLGPWQPVADLSGGDTGMIIDLSGSEFEDGDDDLSQARGLLAGLDPQPWEVAALDQVMAEQAEQEAAQAAADLAVSEQLAAIELSQAGAEREATRLAQAARERERQLAARAMARRYASAAVQAGDFELAAGTLIELSSGREASAIELAAADVSREFGACGILDPETLICTARYHAHGCLHNGTADADADGTLPGGRDALRHPANAPAGGLVTRDGRAATLADAVRAQLGEGTRQPVGTGYGREPAPVVGTMRHPAGGTVARDVLAAHPELTFSPDRGSREAAQQRSLDALADAVLRTGGRAERWGDGPSFTERAQRLAGTRGIVQAGDGLAGSQASLTAARSSRLEG